jgi:hypothetical protein
MARTTVRLTFRGESLNDPIIYRLGKDFKVVTNIRRADVAEGSRSEGRRRHEWRR